MHIITVERINPQLNILAVNNCSSFTYVIYARCMGCAPPNKNTAYQKQKNTRMKVIVEESDRSKTKKNRNNCS